MGIFVWLVPMGKQVGAKTDQIFFRNVYYDILALW